MKYLFTLLALTILFSMNAQVSTNNTTASGNNSTAIGKSTTASDFGSLVIGHFNLSGATVTNSATAFNTANTAFVIGNGNIYAISNKALKKMQNNFKNF